MAKKNPNYCAVCKKDLKNPQGMAAHRRWHEKQGVAAATKAATGRTVSYKVPVMLPSPVSTINSEGTVKPASRLRVLRDLTFTSMLRLSTIFEDLRRSQPTISIAIESIVAKLEKAIEDSGDGDE